MHRCFICWIFLAGILLASGVSHLAHAQHDRASISQADSSADEHTPRGALWRAAVLPGWGQFYNGQYLKIPVVYAGLGGLTTMAIAFNNQYLTYRHAYLYQAYQALVEQGERETHPFPEYREDHERLIQRTGSLSTDILKRHRDKLRRNRDLTYIGLGIAYGLSIVDAYVSAHLADFDVSEDLSLQLYPGTRQLHLRLTFNQ